MPSRIIRGDLLESDRYNALTHDAERLLFMELLLLCDDYGLVPVNAGFLRRRTSPCATKTPEQITQIVSALADLDLIRTYQTDRGGQFAFIPRFDNRPQALKPRWPLPPAHVSQGAIEAAQARSKGIQKKQRVSEIVPGMHRGISAELRITNYEGTSKDRPTTMPLDQETSSGLLTADPVVLESKPDTPPDCPFDAILTAYREILPTCRGCLDLNTTRRDHIRARWRQVWADERFDTPGGIAFFRRFFGLVAASRFLTGRVVATPGRKPFLASLPWLMSPENFLKVLEGNYA